MSRLLTMVSCLGLGVLLSFTMATTQAKYGKGATEVISITRAEWAAEMSKNASSAVKNFHKDCTMWVSDFPNRLDGKDMIYKFYDTRSSGAGSLVLAEMANEKVQIFGDVAILSYNFMGLAKDKEGEVKPIRAKSTRVFLNEGGKWLLVHANFAPVDTPQQ